MLKILFFFVFLIIKSNQESVESDECEVPDDLQLLWIEQKVDNFDSKNNDKWLMVSCHSKIKII